MRIWHTLILTVTLPIAACSTDTTPDFEQVQGAVLVHARCIDEAVKASDVSSGTIEKQARRIQIGCSGEREKALGLKVVPVFQPTVEKYDEMQGGLAANLIADKRSVAAND